MFDQGGREGARPLLDQVCTLGRGTQCGENQNQRLTFSKAKPLGFWDLRLTRRRELPHGGHPITGSKGRTPSAQEGAAPQKGCLPPEALRNKASRAVRAAAPGLSHHPGTGKASCPSLLHATSQLRKDPSGRSVWSDSQAQAQVSRSAL